MSGPDLKRFGVLADLAGDEALDLGARLEKRRLDAGETLFRQGDPGDAMVLLETGSLRLERDGAEGGPATLGPGAVLGALALFLIGAREVSAVAQEETHVLLLSREGYRRLAADSPGAACRLAEAVLAEVAVATRLALALAAPDAVDRAPVDD